MKYTVLALLAGAFAAPVFAGPALDAAVQMSASNASIDSLSQAVYAAAVENPADVANVFSSVISQRDAWSSAQVYSVCRAILLAVPGLEQQLVAEVAAQQAGTSTASQASSLLTALYATTGSASVADSVVSNLLASVNNMVDVARTGVTANAALAAPSVPSPTPVAPAPPAVSDDN